MKAVIHTPRVLVEEWDIPGLLAQDSDDDVLAAVKGVAGTTARRIGQRVTDTAPPYVHARSEDTLAAAGRKVADLQQARDHALRAALDLAMDALDSGASERQVAASLGVDRSVIRARRGK